MPPASTPLPQGRTAHRRAPWVDAGLVLLLFAVARVVSGVLLTHAAATQPDLEDATFWHVEGSRPASPSYLEVLSNWDGQWFKTIALHGYGDVDPASGQNPLGFSPGYPLVVRAVMALGGLGFEAAAGLVSLTASAAALVVLFRWLSTTRGHGPAWSAVVVLSFFPSSPVLQVAYSDGLAMLLLVLLLRAVGEDRWRIAWLVAPCLALTRPVLLPVALLVLLVGWRRHGRRPAAVLADRTLVLRAAGLGLLAFLWPALAAVIGGSVDAYSRTLTSWRRDGLSVGGWFSGLWTSGTRLPAVLLAVVLVALVVVRLRRDRPEPADHLGSWAGAYILFVLATAPPNLGIVRHALLALVPLGTAGVLAPRLGPRRRAALLVSIVAVELVLQWLWVSHVFVVTDPDSALVP